MIIMNIAATMQVVTRGIKNLVPKPPKPWTTCKYCGKDIYQPTTYCPRCRKDIDRQYAT